MIRTYSAIRTLVFLFIACGLAAAASLRAEPEPPRLLATIEPDGTVSAGSKEALRAAVEAGRAIRVGWAHDVNDDGKYDLLHWAEAAFITIWEGEVYTQIQVIRRQGGASNPRRMVLHEKPVRWHGLLSTNGVLEGAFDDGSPVYQQKVKIWWCLAAE